MSRCAASWGHHAGVNFPCAERALPGTLCCARHTPLVVPPGARVVRGPRIGDVLKPFGVALAVGLAGLALVAVVGCTTVDPSRPRACVMTVLGEVQGMSDTYAVVLTCPESAP